jgi:hypothetical protein
MVTLKKQLGKGNRLIAYIKSIINNQDDLNRVYYGDLLWKSIALPTINYACAVWTCGSDSDRNKIESLQLQMARTILRASRNTAKEALYGELGWDSMSTIQTKCRIKYFDRLLKMSDNRFPKVLFNNIFSMYKKKGRDTQWKWLTHIQEALTHCGLDHLFSKEEPFNSNWVQSFLCIQKELNDKTWSDNASNKKTLINYCKYKDKPSFENYLLDATDFYGSSLKFKIRTSTLPLEYNIKSWREQNTGACKLCNMDMEDAYHFLFTCKKLNTIRKEEYAILNNELHKNNLSSF